MANDRDNPGGGEDRQSEFDREKKNEFGQGQQGQQSESSQQGQSGDRQREPLGASHEQGAKGGSVTAAGGSSTGPGAGQVGTDRDSGFVGSQGEESGEYLQEGGSKQAGFAEQGRGAPDQGGDIERGGERTANRDSDIEGSSENR